MNDYDSKKPLQFITHLNMNNLYGWILSSYLCYGRFKQLKNLDWSDVMSISEKSPEGFFSRS